MDWVQWVFLAVGVFFLLLGLIGLLARLLLEPKTRMGRRG